MEEHGPASEHMRGAGPTENQGHGHGLLVQMLGPVLNFSRGTQAQCPGLRDKTPIRSRVIGTLVSVHHDVPITQWWKHMAETDLQGVDQEAESSGQNQTQGSQIFQIPPLVIYFYLPGPTS